MKKLIFISAIFFTGIVYIFSSNLNISHMPGVFNQNIILELSNTTGENIFYSFKESADSAIVKYSVPIILSAIPGERRVYKLDVFMNKEGEQTLLKTLVYTIDKTIPLQPEVNRSEGVFNEDISISFNNSDSSIFYTIADDTSNRYIKWNGSPILIRQNDELRVVTLRAYARNSAGNKSSLIVRRYTMLPIVHVPKNLNIYSPVNGKYLNSQLLYIDTKGFNWVRYSIGNNDPAKYGTTYRYPVLFKAKGDYTLNIAGLPDNSTKIMKKTIKFSILGNDKSIVNFESGMYTEPISIRLKESNLLYDLSDSESSAVFRQTYGKDIKLIPVPGLIKYIPLRVRTADNGEDAEFRYFYVFDNRTPGTPVINISRDLQAKNVKIEILGNPDTDIYYTIDGSTPDQYASKYLKPFSINLTDDIKTGSRIIKAVAYFKNKISSSIASKLVTYDFLPPEKPQINIKKIDQRTYRFTIINKESNYLFYNVNYSGLDPADPDMTSFNGSNDFYMSFPHGISGQLKMKAVLMDNSGNYSDLASVSLIFDTLPPSPPKIELNSDSIVLKGKEELFYNITLGNELPELKLTDFQRYAGPISRDSIHGFDKIFAFALDEQRNKSEVAVYKIPNINTDSIRDVRYIGVKDGGVYNSKRTIRFFPDEKTVLYYSFTDNNEIPADPQINPETKIVDSLFFDCEEGKRKEIFLKIRAVGREKENYDKIYEIKFTIDKEIPFPPVIRNITDGAVYNRPVSVKIESSESSIWVLYKSKISESERYSIETYLNEGVLVNGNFNIDIDSGTDKSFEISAVALDTAGNFAFSQDIIHFRIDKEIPEPPVFSGISENEESGSPVTFSLHSAEDDNIYYNIKNDGTIPDSFEGEKYSTPVTLECPENHIIHFVIRAWTVDEAGNKSVDSVLKNVTISKLKVKSIEPEINWLNDTTSIISFPESSEITIYYKKGNNDFRIYDNPILITLRNRESDTFFYYAVDQFNNKSAISSRILISRNRKGVMITGVRNNGVYNHKVVIARKNHVSSIRYEITNNDDPDADGLPVTYFSPELKGDLVFDAAEGEVLNLTLKVQEFSKDTHVPISNMEIYRFTIDREIPEPPVITGVENKEYYQNGRKLVLSVSDGKIFYRIIKNDNVENNYKQYSEPIFLDTDEGHFSEYQISAYALDSAGNKSDLRTVKFSIDKAIVYLSSMGKDIYDGTRSRPLKTLKKALELVKDTGRKSIYVTEGEFILPDEIVIDQDIAVFGGFGFEAWNKSTEKTLFTRKKGESSENALFKIVSGNITFHNVSMTNFGLKSSVILQVGGSLYLSNSEIIFADGRGSTAIRTKSGKLSLNKTDILVGPVRESTLFSLSNCSLEMTHVRISGTGSFGKLKVFNFDNVASAVMEHISVNPAAGQIIEIFNFNKSNIILTGSNIETGTSKISTSIFSLVNSSLVLKNNQFSSNNQSRILSFLDSNNSKISMLDSSLTGLSKNGISIFKINNSEILLDSVRMDVKRNDDFIYFLRTNLSNVSIKNSVFNLRKSSDFTFIDGKNTIFNFVNNKVTMDVKGIKAKIMNFKDMKRIIIKDNKIIQIRQTNAVPLKIEGNNMVTLTGNIFKGWRSILDYNGISIRTGEELNTYSGLITSPVDNRTE